MLAAARAAVECTRAESTDARPSGRSPLAGISGRLTGPGRVAGWSLAILNRSGAPPHVITCFATPINRGGLAGVDGGWMGGRWYQEAVIYCVEVGSFQDSDGDGCGDLRGLDQPAGLPRRASGVTCLWLNPIHPSPRRDDGYDVADYYGVDPRLGSLGDFAELTRAGARAGHPDPARPGRQPHLRPASLVPRRPAADPTRRTATGTCGATTSRRTAGRASSFPASRPRPGPSTSRRRRWYFHRFYDFQPDLNWANPAVRAEISKVMGFWLQLGASGFRVDAAPFVLEQVGARRRPGPAGLLDPGRLAAGPAVAGRRLRSCCARRTSRRATSRSTPAAARTDPTTAPT